MHGTISSDWRGQSKYFSSNQKNGSLNRRRPCCTAVQADSGSTSRTSYSGWDSPGKLESEDNLVAFHNIAKLPPRDDIGDTAVGLHRGDLYLADQFSIAADHENAALFYARRFSHVEHDKVPLGVNGDDIPFDARHWRWFVG